MAIKRTRKYVMALNEAPGFAHTTSDQLYRHLIESGWYWDTKCGLWIKAADQNNDPPSTHVKIGLSTNKNQVEEIAEEVIEGITYDQAVMRIAAIEAKSVDIKDALLNFVTEIYGINPEGATAPTHSQNK